MTDLTPGWRTIMHKLAIEQAFNAAGITYRKDEDFGVDGSEEFLFFEVDFPKYETLTLFICVHAEACTRSDGTPYCTTTAGIRFRETQDPVHPDGDEFAFVGAAATTAAMLTAWAVSWQGAGA